MAKKQVKKIVKKSVGSLSDYKAKKSAEINKEGNGEKPLSWIPFNKGFHDALGIPGIPRGYVTLFRGFSDTGKSTAIYEAIAGAQKRGDVPVIIDTEGNFNWNHARTIGMEFEEVWGEVVDEVTGEVKQGVIDHTGDFMFFTSQDLLDMYQNFDYTSGKMGSKPLRYAPVVEDVAKLINTILDDQAKGEIPHNLCFLWDSIGSLGCFKGETSGASNNMWTAGALEASFSSFLNFRLPSSRSLKSEYTNTFAAVQKIWLNSMGMGQPTVEHKGGKCFYYGARYIIHLGGKQGSSVTKKKATTGGKEYLLGSEVRIQIDKDQLSGMATKGKILSTPHGYISPDDFDQYKKDHKEYIKEKLNTDIDDFEIVTEITGDDDTSND